MKSSRSWVSLAVILILVAVGWWWFTHRDDGARDEQEISDSSSDVFDRVWIDTKPHAYTDYVQAFVVLSDIPLGIFQKSSSYRAELEVFEYAHKGNQLSVVFPQDDKKAKFGFKVTACDDLPPFDMCLSLTKNPWHGPKKYYSMRDPDAMLDAKMHELRHRADALPPVVD